MMDQNSVLLLAISAAILILLIMAWLFFRKKKSGKERSPYIDALNALLTNDRPMAIQKLRETVSRDSQNVDAYLKLGILLREEGDIERALKIHRNLTVRPLSPIHKREVMMAVASDYLAGGHIAQARRVIGELLSMDRQDIWAHETLLRIYEETGDWDRAYETLKQVQRLRGKDDREMLALYKVFAGRALDEKGEHHKARLKYKDALRIDEQCTAAYLFLGDSYVAERRFDDATGYWMKMMEAVPEQAYLCFERLEKTQFELGDFNSMIEIYDELIQKRPEDLPSLFAYVRIKEKMGQIDEAIALCRQALERDPASPEARWCLVRCYHARGDTKQALRYALDLEKTYRQRRVFTCRTCGYQSSEVRWRCPECKSWRTFL